MGSTGTVDSEVDPGAVLEVGVSAVPVKEEHAALVPALVLGTQKVDAQRGAFLNPHTTCTPRSSCHSQCCRLRDSCIPGPPTHTALAPTDGSVTSLGSGANCPTWQQQGLPVWPGCAWPSSTSAGATEGWEGTRDKNQGGCTMVEVGHTDI